jgi:predicted O-methyltransferase YrrM
MKNNDTLKLPTGFMDIDFSSIETHDTFCLDEIKDKIQGQCRMEPSEQYFINGIIRKAKPKKVLEIGVAAGGSSCIILNAIKDDASAHLFSEDYVKTSITDMDIVWISCLGNPA